MLNQEIIIKRLALIKHLYKIGVELSRQFETIAAFSILSLHDSVEMFLKLLAEHKDIKSENFNFLDYWTKIPELTLKESMRNLNTRRVNIKHKGLLPSKADIEISRVNTTDFFEQNTIIHFDVEWKDISLLTLIQYDKVRQYLEKAQQALEENKIEDCIESAAIAFDELLYTYEDSKSSFFGSSPFYFCENIESHYIEKNDGNMLEFVDKLKKSLNNIQKALKILSFGIDYKKFVKFKLLTPIVRRTMGGIYVTEIWGKKKWTKENCQYCIDFVLDSSLKLQEFDFDINELIENNISAENIFIKHK
ncbi:MAG: hypothetical protein ACOXZ9_03300 [Bacteroidales bacterium]